MRTSRLFIALLAAASLSAAYRSAHAAPRPAAVAADSAAPAAAPHADTLRFRPISEFFDSTGHEPDLDESMLLAPMVHEGAHGGGDAYVTTGRNAGSDPRCRHRPTLRVRRMTIHAKSCLIREGSVGPDGGDGVLLPVTPRAAPLLRRSIPLAVRGGVAEAAGGSPRRDTAMALRETGERGPSVGSDRPVVSPVALNDALRRPRWNGVGGVTCVGMTVGAVERLMEPVGGIVDLEAPFRSTGRHPQVEAVAKQASLLIGGTGDTPGQDPEEDHGDPRKAKSRKNPSIRHGTSRLC